MSDYGDETIDALRAQLAAAEAERDAYRQKWESVPLYQIADVIDHYRAGLKPEEVHGRLAMTIGFLMDHTDWIPAIDGDKWRQWHERMHRPYKRHAPQEPPHD